ncbi:hypothetical protein GOBAR_DD18721 [Gossypium barbadense]|nr:hypothetical protein GOBAR_DD18721 [Gossypium barbadense]
MHRQGMKFEAMGLVAILVLGLVGQGFCVCSLNDIIVGTVRTGVEVQGMAEWKVTIINNCKCAQHKLTLSCDSNLEKLWILIFFRNKATIASLSTAML